MKDFMEEALALVGSMTFFNFCYEQEGGGGVGGGEKKSPLV